MVVPVVVFIRQIIGVIQHVYRRQHNSTLLIDKIDCNVWTILMKILNLIVNCFLFAHCFLVIVRMIRCTDALCNRERTSQSSKVKLRLKDSHLECGPILLCVHRLSRNPKESLRFSFDGERELQGFKMWFTIYLFKKQLFQSVSWSSAGLRGFKYV